MLTLITFGLGSLWFALPLLAFVANAKRHRRLHPVLLFGLTVSAGCLLLFAGAEVTDMRLTAEMKRFDLDGDGGFGGAELTPDAQKAIDAWASDAGRTMVIFTGIPVSAIWAGVCFAILATGQWIVAHMRPTHSAATSRSTP
jgi:hypothetical protein